MATHSQAERDAMTVEIAYAVVSAVFLACVTGLLLASPILLLGLHGSAMKAVGGVGLAGAVGVLLWRLVSVLWRFRR
ncbi:DUF6332 family protein [Streptacidiphilus sp. PAMC 29251]